MKKAYSITKINDKNIIRMYSRRDIGLFNAICAESHASLLLAPNNTRALPQRLAKTKLPVSYITEKGKTYDLPAGSYVAAYNTPESEHINGLYYVVPITEQDVLKLKAKAEKFGIPFGTKIRPVLSALPSFRTSELAINRLLLTRQARLIYKSPSVKTPLIKMIEILPKEGTNGISLYAEGVQGEKKQFSQKVYPGQILALTRDPKDKTVHLSFVMPEDCVGIIAQNRLMCRELGIKTNTMRALNCLSQIAKRNCHDRS